MHNLKMLLVKLPEPKFQKQKMTYVPPIGLWSIAHNFMKWRPVDVEVIDLHIQGQGLAPLSSALSKNRYSAVGLSAQFSIQNSLYEEAALLAKAAGKYVIAGGFHAAAIPKPDGVDDVVKGGGELHCAGKVFSDIDYPTITESMMIPYWEAGAPHDLQSKTRRWMPVEFSRGCDHHCGFCGVNGFWGGVQYFSREKVAKHLKALKDIGIEELFIEDDNVIADYDLFSWLKTELMDYGFSWSTPNGIRAHDLTLHLDGLVESGCWRVSLPFETGSRHTANLMRIGNKWMAHDDALSLVERLKGQGIKTCGFFIIGYPGETMADMQKTLDYANSLPLDQRNIYIATPYPGTHLYDTCVKNGYIDIEPPELYDRLLYTGALISTPEFTAAEVEALKAADRQKAIERIANS